MSKFSVRLVAFTILVSLAGCSGGKGKRPASSSRIYEGDTSPTIRYNDEPEAAGGPLNPY